VSGSWQAERGSHRTRRLPLEDPRAEVGEDVRVGVGPMEFKLKSTRSSIRVEGEVEWILVYITAGFVWSPSLFIKFVGRRCEHLQSGHLYAIIDMPKKFGTIFCTPYFI